MASPKRPRVAQDRPSTVLASACLSLTSLPIEILAEILICTHSPATIVAVSRTCSFLYRSLALNPAASFIWRSARQTCDPPPLPDPEALNWRMNEAKYAALVFGGGVCEVCQKTTREMYASFATRIRLCSNWHCRRTFRKSMRLVHASMPVEERKHLWVPCVESNVCFRLSSNSWNWPECRLLLVRRTDLASFQTGFPRYKAAKEAEATRQGAGGPSVLPEEDASNLDFMNRCDVAVERMARIMELSVKLIDWKVSYDEARKRVERANNSWTKNLAEREGWDYEDIVASQAYGSMQRRKNFLVEEITSQDVTCIRSAIESELLAVQARRKRQKAEASHKDSMSGLKKIYERMRCGTTEGSNDLSILPTPGVFFTLPSVRVLKGSPDPGAAPTSKTGEIKSSPLATSLVRSDIHAWLTPVEKHLMRLLGYPNGWQSASTRALPPLKRVTARFFCRRCGEGKVGKEYQREGCLDLRGVCSHVCVTKQGKRGPREGETGDTGADAESGPEKGQRRGKRKKRVKTLDWTVDVFEKDEKAIRLIKTVLRFTGFLGEENPCTASELQGKGGFIRCTTCTGWIVMDFDTAIGHAHRHECMEIQLMPLFAPEDVMSLRDTSLAASRLAFERGTAELLLGPTLGAQGLTKRVNYGCRHCILVEEAETPTVDVNSKGARAMNLNSLRSHAKEKHGISDMRDEDFFCYSCIHGETQDDR